MVVSVFSICPARTRALPARHAQIEVAPLRAAESGAALRIAQVADVVRAAVVRLQLVAVRALRLLRRL